MRKKGISAIIAVVLLLLITVAIAGFTFVFLMGTYKTTTNATENQIQTTTSTMGESFEIDNIDAVNNVVSIRNTGISRLTGLSVYVDDIPVNSYADPIEPKNIGEISILDPLSSGEHLMRISSTGADEASMFSVPDTMTMDIDVSGIG